MGSLLEEYRKRYGIDCVWPTNEGFLFFNDDKGEPVLVVVTSSYTKSLEICSSCPVNTNGVTLEILVPVRHDRIPGGPSSTAGVSLSVLSHTHVPPDADLIGYIRRHVPAPLGEVVQPYIGSGTRDLEQWLWSMYKSFLPSKVRKRLKNLCWMDEMVKLITSGHASKVKNFYDYFYLKCFVGRSYLLMG